MGRARGLTGVSSLFSGHRPGREMIFLVLLWCMQVACLYRYCNDPSCRDNREPQARDGDKKRCARVAKNSGPKEV